MRARNQVDLEEFKRLYYDGYTHKDLCGYFHVSTESLARIVKENGLSRAQKIGRPKKALVEKFEPMKPARKARNNEFSCPVCGAVKYDYVGRTDGEWAYRRCVNNRERKLCSWSCCVRFDKLMEGAKKDAAE